jgi:tetratricopeptide (TPR) repeat protein
MASYEKARSHFQALANEFPTNSKYQKDLASCDNHIGGVREMLGETAEARSAYDQAQARLQKLVDSNPKIPDFQSELGGVLNNLASLDMQSKRWPEARDRLIAAVRSQKTALKANPRNRSYRRYLYNHYYNLFDTYRAMRRPEECVATAREMIALSADDGQRLYDGACQLALCVPAMSDPAISAGLADEAFATLKQAVAAGWTNAQQTARDPDLASLHSRDDFKQLVAALFDRIFPADPFAR